MCRRTCLDCDRYKNGWCAVDMPPWVSTAYKNSAGFVFRSPEKFAKDCVLYVKSAEAEERDARPQEG